MGKLAGNEDRFPCRVPPVDVDLVLSAGAPAEVGDTGREVNSDLNQQGGNTMSSGTGGHYEIGDKEKIAEQRARDKEKIAEQRARDKEEVAEGDRDEIPNQFVLLPSPDDIVRAMTPAGAWDKKTLASWGVPWPPPRGWRRELEQRWLATQSPDFKYGPQPDGSVIYTLGIGKAEADEKPE